MSQLKKSNNTGEPNEILDRLKHAYDIHSDAELSRFLNLNPSTIATWRSSGSMKFDRIFEYTRELNINWLLYGDGPVWRRNLSSTNSPQTLEPAVTYDPLITEPSRKARSRPDETIYLGLPGSYVRNELGYAPDELLLTRAQGKGMEPTIRHGDLLLIHRKAERPFDSQIYLLNLDGSLICRRITEQPGRKLRLTCDNPAVDPVTVTENQKSLKIIGQVIWFGRAL